MCVRPITVAQFVGYLDRWAGRRTDELSVGVACNLKELLERFLVDGRGGYFSGRSPMARRPQELIGWMLRSSQSWRQRNASGTFN